SGSEEDFSNLEDHIAGLVRSCSPIDLRLWQPAAKKASQTAIPEIRDAFVPPQAQAGMLNVLSKLVPIIETFGQVWRSSHAEHLTEPEAEYVLEVSKHVYSRHLVLHVRVTNTLSDIWLRNATLLCIPSPNED